MEKKAKGAKNYFTATISLMVLIVAIMAIGGYTAGVEIDKISAHENLLTPQSGKVAGVEVEQVQVNVDLSDQTVLTMDVEISDGDTVMDALQRAIDLSGLVLKTTTYDFGEIVDQIGDLPGGQDNKYWIYYVNGESGLVSVDTMEVFAGDVIEFKFEESIF